jgi:hypothetical protein
VEDGVAGPAAAFSVPAAALSSFLFDPLRGWLDRLPSQPDAVALAELAERHPVGGPNGKTVRFVPPRVDGLAYECRVWETGKVETRPDNWHDFFNGLVWLSFPETKRAVTAAHVAAMQSAGAARGSRRDALTHFDECGIAVVSGRPELLELLRGFEWKELFVRYRADVRAAMRFFVFGHATYEALLAPFRGLTAKAVLLEVGEECLLQPPASRLAAVDTLLAVELASGRYNLPRDFQPLPLLGIPGVTPDSENPAYYDDTWQFRPGRGATKRAA